MISTRHWRKTMIRRRFRTVPRFGEPKLCLRVSAYLFSLQIHLWKSFEIFALSPEVEWAQRLNDLRERSKNFDGVSLWSVVGLDDPVDRPILALFELFAGLVREGHKEPVRYPVACVPQAWAAGSVFQIIKACLNMQPDAKNGTVDCGGASLPAWLGQVVVKRIQVGGQTVDLRLPLN